MTHRIPSYDETFNDLPAEVKPDPDQCTQCEGCHGFKQDEEIVEVGTHGEWGWWCVGCLNRRLKV